MDGWMDLGDNVRGLVRVGWADLIILMEDLDSDGGDFVQI